MLYKIRLTFEYDHETGVFTITSPDVPGLVTVASKPQEVYKNVQEAIEALLAGLAELGKEPPPALRTPQTEIHTTEMLVIV